MYMLYAPRFTDEARSGAASYLQTRGKVKAEPDYGVAVGVNAVNMARDGRSEEEFQPAIA